ncbi:TonB-dependent receptor [Algicola sagamiensis]|uniref:TonB-dependent receptor n=1 Tax=Algicola sagamiensis TaxID=163869 RepID=UPI000377CD8B|nr:TonB-dependent receptor [Algicola sagamiensis]
MKLVLSLLSASLLSAANAKASNNIERIQVQGDFRQTNIMDVPSHVTLIDEAQIERRQAQHLESIYQSLANVNFSAGASRGKFVQIRGIGERSQFTDSINPSVGMTIDSIDYSGLGLGSSLFDINQIEIFRGPQGTRFGNSAMAGMIHMMSTAPEDQSITKLKLGVQQYGGKQLNIANTGPLSDSLNYRFSYSQFLHDGYQENQFLRRIDTQGFDEQTGRFQLAWQASDTLKLHWTTHWMDFDNGYDGFSLDNTRRTFSDKPGQDTQNTLAHALNAKFSGFNLFDLESTVTLNDTETQYGYDEDWTYPRFHPDGYASEDHYDRKHQQLTLDSRAISKTPVFSGRTDYIFGLYTSHKENNLNRKQSYHSEETTQQVALYSQLDTRLSRDLTLITGLRFEQYQSDFTNSHQLNLKHQEDLWGGQIALHYQIHANQSVFARWSRGYKAGGFNGEALSKAKDNPHFADILAKHGDFQAETLISRELGLKGVSQDQNLQYQLTFFHSKRQDMQVKGWAIEASEHDFTGFIVNANGTNYGLEAEFQFQVAQDLELSAAVGYLKTELKDFVTSTGIDQSGREQAQSPNLSYSTNLLYDITDAFSFNTTIEGKSAYYLSDNHDTKTDDVTLLHADITYQQTQWQILLWGKNLTDETYPVRGFYFGNDPRDGYTEHAYYQFGAPREFGLTFTMTFE